MLIHKDKQTMDIHLRAEYIFNKLNEAGAGLGNASIFIIKSALEDLADEPKDIRCVACKSLLEDTSVYCDNCGTYVKR